MKAFILTEEDFKRLLIELELSKFKFTKADDSNEDLYKEIHSRFHYLICRWMDEVKK